MIAFNQIRRATRPTWRPSQGAGPKLVPACFYGFSEPRKGSPVLVKAGAQRVLEWWPHSRQQALYAAIEAGRLRFFPKANGHEMAALSRRFQHHYVVVRRTPDGIVVTALYNELPVWGGH